MSALALTLVVSLAALVVLAWRDPRRRRARRAPARRDRWRPVLIAPIIVSPLALAATGHWAGLAIWTGVMSISGWLTARALA